MRLVRPARARPLGFVAVAGVLLAPVAVSAAQAGAARPAKPAASVRYAVGTVSEVSVGCPRTGDVAEAVDPARGYVYQSFEGCDDTNGIGLARSTDGGGSYTPPVVLPDSPGGWDPSLAVAPDGTLYAGFMNTLDHRNYPVIDVSHDHGRTFHVARSLKPAQARNAGDADYLAVGSNGTLYVAWDYGPSNAEIRSKCSPNGSCWDTNGDVNVVVQSSTDDAGTFTPRAVVNPGYPDGGAIEGDVAVAADGAVDVLYQGYKVLDRRTLALGDGHEYFTTSTDGGKQWSAPAQATPGDKDVAHITEVTGAGSRGAYVASLNSNDGSGYALYLRTFSISAGDGCGRWLSGAVRISPQFGEPGVFPGDTFGVSTFSPTALVVSWGSAVHGSKGEANVFAAPVSVLKA